MSSRIDEPLLPPRRPKDTPAWVFQSWAAFLLAVGLVGWGIEGLAVDAWVRSFLGLGAFGLVSATFTLSKTLRDNQYRRVDSGAWIFQVWMAFLVTLLAVSIGTYHLPGERWEKGFVGLGVLFLTAASFTLAKTIRDNQEAQGGTVED